MIVLFSMQSYPHCIPKSFIFWGVTVSGLVSLIAFQVAVVARRSPWTVMWAFQACCLPACVFLTSLRCSSHPCPCKWGVWFLPSQSVCISLPLEAAGILRVALQGVERADLLCHSHLRERPGAELGTASHAVQRDLRLGGQCHLQHRASPCL